MGKKDTSSSRTGHNCDNCGSSNTKPWGKAMPRRYCIDCGRTYITTKRRNVKMNTHTVTAMCPACETVTKHYAICGNRARKYHYLRCESCGVSHRSTLIAPRGVKEAKGQRFVITGAQNDTAPDHAFLKALQVYAEHNAAQLIVVPMRYRNPTTPEEDADWTYHKAVLPYLVNDRMRLCDGLVLMADIHVQPTAAQPLSGLDTMTGQDSAIVAHTKIAWETIPTRGHELPKLMLTTGAVTKPNYSDSKAGAKGKHHHVLGALVVEVDGETFHVRHINCDRGGKFIDLGTQYSKDGVSVAPPPLAIVLGDLHAERADEDNLSAVHEIIDALRPQAVVLHDALDSGSISHHNGYLERIRRRVTKTDNLMSELRTTCGMIDGFSGDGRTVHVVSSNHHDHLSRWIERHENALDIENARLYHYIKARAIDEIHETHQIPDIFAMLAKEMCQRPINFVAAGDSLVIGGIECGYHGDRGPNGTRGSAKSFDRIGVKTIIGHSHTPRIVGGCYQVGTSSRLQMGYNDGAPSSWLHTHCLIYANGKRTLLNVINGKAWNAQ